ncbi:MAG: type II secretion system F family protein [Candidatus Eremiobacterota bacterium]
MRSQPDPETNGESEMTREENLAARTLLGRFGDLSETVVREALLDLREGASTDPSDPPSPEPPPPAGGWAERIQPARGDGEEMPALARARSMIQTGSVALAEASAPALPGAGVPQSTVTVGMDQVAIFYRRLATMLGAGVTVTRAIEFLKQSEEDPRLAEVLEEVAARLHSGRTLSASMGGNLSRVFQPVAVGIVQLGEQTGALLAALNKLADLMEVQMRQRKAIQAALTYPSVLLVVLGLVFFLFVFILAPGDAGLLGAVGGQLPWPTRVLVAVRGGVHSPWVLLAVLGGLGLLALWSDRLLRENATVRATVHGWMLRQPVLGDLIRKTLSARMLYVVSTALQVGVSLLQALRMARAVCTNEHMAGQLDEAIRSFQNGDELARSLERRGVFPRLVTSLIHMGLETGNLDAMLARLSDTYEEEVEMTLDNAARLVEPFLLALIGVLAGFLALATVLPILQVVDRL